MLLIIKPLYHFFFEQLSLLQNSDCSAGLELTRTWFVFRFKLCLSICALSELTVVCGKHC